MRLDQWLWAVRVYKTRTLAAGAIRSGHVRIQDLPAKPAREVHPGEVVVVQLERIRPSGVASVVCRGIVRSLHFRRPRADAAYS